MNIFLIFVMCVKLAAPTAGEGGEAEEEEVARQTPIARQFAEEIFGPEVSQYINNKIDQLLLKNPEKDIGDLKLNGELNEERIKLKKAKIINTGNITKEEEQQVQQAIGRFTKYVAEYESISNQVKVALGELALLQQNNNLPVDIKYKALLLQHDLQDSGSVKEAAKDLKRYQKFKREYSSSPGNNTITLSDEHRKYFEEILELLKGHSLLDNPKMQNFLQELLDNPEQLKTLAEALKNLEGGYDEDINESWFGIFELFLG
ncbi:hypothetical protein FF38_04124 [Lucilia cuprina]|uniref:Uncharacterized protein n=1 Tax=Lucilia cuprina TaxID=7375 RepID=A0A0L0BRT5_LUCCU|nr:hypothetical protein CVS40_7381 [Lucilia cuprina]KNC22757.1 hypothetical protein FF38_04124 [Lucilia cuprina]